MTIYIIETFVVTLNFKIIIIEKREENPQFVLNVIHFSLRPNATKLSCRAF